MMMINESELRAFAQQHYSFWMRDGARIAEVKDEKLKVWVWPLIRMPDNEYVCDDDVCEMRGFEETITLDNAIYEMPDGTRLRLGFGAASCTLVYKAIVQHAPLAT